MKKLPLLLFIITTITSVNISAQVNVKSKTDKLKYGIKVGVNFANVEESPTPTINIKQSIGITGGAFVTIPIDSNFSIQPEILYSQMGATISNGSIYNREAKLVLSYIDVPILAKYDFTKSFGIYGGPQIGFLNSAVFKSPDSMTDYPNTDFSKNVKKLDLRAIVGADLHFSEVMYLSGRFQLGLVNVSSSTNGVTDKNNAITLTLNIMLSY